MSIHSRGGKATQNLKLSPGDLTFLWDECPRCFYLKVIMGINRPPLRVADSANTAQKHERTPGMSSFNLTANNEKLATPGGSKESYTYS